MVPWTRRGGYTKAVKLFDIIENTYSYVKSKLRQHVWVGHAYMEPRQGDLLSWLHLLLHDEVGAVSERHSIGGCGVHDGPWRWQFHFCR